MNMDRGIFFSCHYSLNIQYSNYIHSIDNVLRVTGDLEMILRMREDVGRFICKCHAF